MSPEERVARLLELSGRALEGSARGPEVRELARLFLELDSSIRAGEELPEPWRFKRCRMRFLPGVLMGPDRDRRLPRVPARCRLQEGHPLDPSDDVGGGHAWGDDSWPEFPDGKPPERRQR